MLVYVVEHLDDGVAMICSSFEKAIGWVRNNGAEWGEDDAEYTIVAQYVDGDPKEFESFGVFDAKGKSITDERF